MSISNDKNSQALVSGLKADYIQYMTKILSGERIGRLGKISTGCSAVVFDGAKQKILLTRRTDNGQWCLPSGRIEPGESAAQACLRELQEETGLEGETTKLIGVYSNPNQLIEYPDGNRIHLISLCLEVRITGGKLSVSDETTEFGYFGLIEINSLDILPNHRERIRDAFAHSIAAFIR